MNIRGKTVGYVIVDGGRNGSAQMLARESYQGHFTADAQSADVYATRPEATEACAKVSERFEGHRLFVSPLKLDSDNIYHW